MMVLDLDPTEMAHLASALKQWSRWCRDNGIPVPDGISQMRRLASERQRATMLRPVEDSPDTAFMTEQLAVTYTEAGRRIGGVSKRTIERLVASGALPAVAIGGAPRIRVADLDEYVSQLGRHNFRDAVTVKSERQQAS